MCTLLSLEMELTTRVQILDKAICISLCANTLRKGMNPSLQLWINNKADWVL